ncbi:hydrophobin-251 [Armillaria borealis]|uniref:Hydrophobin n=1 Tax=Armillaria borealis TaxID=47425 RepID=A0AA39J1M3_9AGAR|nr:hydrophobin-251 [Armillaria borealis]
MMLALLSFAALVTATVLSRIVVDNAACGAALCCECIQSSSDLTPRLETLLSLLGIATSGLTADVGVSCFPIAAGGTQCNDQAVCCNNNNFNGIVALGCTPID